MNKSQMVRRHIMEHPDHINAEIARQVGCTKGLVSVIRRDVISDGSARARQAFRRNMTLKQLDEAILKAVYSGNLVDAVLDE